MDTFFFKLFCIIVLVSCGYNLCELSYLDISDELREICILLRV